MTLDESQRLEEKWGDTDEPKSFADAMACLEYALARRTEHSMTGQIIIDSSRSADGTLEVQRSSEPIVQGIHDPQQQSMQGLQAEVSDFDKRFTDMMTHYQGLLATSQAEVERLKTKLEAEELGGRNLLKQESLRTPKADNILLPFCEPVTTSSYPAIKRKLP